MKIKTQKQTFIDFLKRSNIAYEEEEAFSDAFAPEDIITAKGFKFHFLRNQSQKMTFIQNDEPFNLPHTQDAAKKSREFEECARILLEYDSWEPMFKDRTDSFHNKYATLMFFPETSRGSGWALIFKSGKEPKTVEDAFFPTLTAAKKAFCEWLVREATI